MVIISTRYCDSVTSVYMQVKGAATLLEELEGMPMAGNHLFSSISATIGNEGQTVYTAANASLLHMAETRAQTGSLLTATGWGPWAGRGMATSHHLVSRLHRIGASAPPVSVSIARELRWLHESVVLLILAFLCFFPPKRRAG